jgi:tetratricopeptide (TPR) repeat protein
VVAQALLEKAIAIDPSYGQAHGVLATSHTFGAHMGWEDVAAATAVAERAALAAILADSEDPWAHHALGCVYLFTRRFDDSLAEFELALRLNPNFSLAQGYYGLALSYIGRWEEADAAARIAAQSTRPVFGGLLRDRRLRTVQRAQLRRGDTAFARRHPTARRFRRRPPSADGRRGHDRPN